MQQTNEINGLVKYQSPYDVQTTVDNVTEVLNNMGMIIFATIDHAMAASKIEISLRPTQTIIFGNPKSGTPFMLNSQTAAIDLPQKIVIWLDEDEQVYLAYNHPQYLATRHLIENVDELIITVSQALEKIATSSLS